MEHILRVNMTDRSIREEPLPDKYRLLGGRGLTAAILFDEMDPQGDPLGAENKLILASGLLAGTSASSTNRISIGAKSPLTRGIKESNGGGMTALRLAQQGYRALVVEGKPLPGEFYIIVMGDGPVRVEKADHLAGKTTSETAEILQEKYGKKAAMALIGPAGEMQLTGSGIANLDKDGHPGRYCARGGLGAVMGSKGLKGVVILPGQGQRKPLRPELWKDSVEQYHQTIRSLPVTAELFPKYGTPTTLEFVNVVGALPTKNFRFGSFEQADKVSGENLYNLIVSRGGEGTPTHACMAGCLVRCSNRFAGPDGKMITAPMEYENNALLGPNLGIDEFDTIAQLNRLCNDLGLDTIETGAAIGVAMEAGQLSFGDGEAALDLLAQVGRGTEIGRVVGMGVVAAGQYFGVERVPAVMGQAIPGYDPRGMKVNGVTYATSAMGADHTCGNAVNLRNIDQSDPTGKAEISKSMQWETAVLDLLGLCIFCRPVYKQALEAVIGMVNALHDVDLTQRELEEIAEQLIAIELEFNRRAGFKTHYNPIPAFMKTEPLSPYGYQWDIRDEELADVWGDLLKRTFGH